MSWEKQQEKLPGNRFIPDLQMMFVAMVTLRLDRGIRTVIHDWARTSIPFTWVGYQVCVSRLGGYNGDAFDVTEVPPGQHTARGLRDSKALSLSFKASNDTSSEGSFHFLTRYYFSSFYF